MKIEFTINDSNQLFLLIDKVAYLIVPNGIFKINSGVKMKPKKIGINAMPADSKRIWNKVKKIKTNIRNLNFLSIRLKNLYIWQLI